MHRSIRVYGRVFSYLFLAFFLLQVSAISPVSAANDQVLYPSERTFLQAEPALTLSASSLVSPLAIGETGEIALEIENSSASPLSKIQLDVPYHEYLRFMDVNGQDLDSHLIELGNLEGSTKLNITLLVHVLAGAPDFINLQFIVLSVESNSVETELTLVIDTGTSLNVGEGEIPAPESVTADPSSWEPVYTPPGASEYTGAAQFSYPITVVPGVGGLTPELTLFYNSGGLDNIRGPLVMSQGFGEGWSLPQAQIVNGNTANLYTGNGYGGDLKNFQTTRFTLELNGVSFRLKPITSARHGLYTATGDPSLYIEFIDGSSDSTLTNITGEYWVVRTADGTEYRFGFNEDSEQVVAPVSELLNSQVGYLQPRNPRYSAYSWKLDRITNTNDINILYTYRTKCGAIEDNSSQCRSVATGVDDTEVDVALDKILYNYIHGQGYRSEIVFDYTVTNSDAVERAMFMLAGWFKPSGIRLFHDGQTLKSYSFIYKSYNHKTDSDATNWTTEFWMLTSITEVGSDGVTALPVTTFTYERKAPKSCDLDVGGTSRCIELLTRVDNGYGAVTKLVYEEFGDRFYRVTDVYSWDGVEHFYNGSNGTAATHIEYDRENATRCHDTDGSGCHSPSAGASGNLVGFSEVIIRTYDPASATPDTALTESKQTFNITNYWLNGKVENSITYDPITHDPITEQINDWQVQSLTEGIFTYLNESTTLNYAPEDQYEGVKVQYLYATYNQGNRQWGQVTGQEVFTVSKDINGDVSSLYSHGSRTRYVTNESDWIIVPWLRRSLDSNSNTSARTFYLYDGAMDPDNQVPVGGNLTLTRAQKNLIDIDPGSLELYETVDTSYTYDSFGNILTVKNYSEYGQVGTVTGSGDWTFWTSAGNGSSGRVTTSSYSGYGLQLRSVSNPLGHVTEISYESEFPWLPTSITDVENDITTKYEYDPFGRLFTVFEQSDFSGYGDGDPWNGNPVTRYRYWDNTWNHQWLSLSPFVITVQTWPAQWGSPIRSEVSTQYDGFGRVINIREHGHNLDDGSVKDVITVNSYNALGNIECSSVPFTPPTPGSIADVYGCDDQSSKTITGYDALARPSLVTAPDGSQTATIYGFLSTYSFNAENQLQAAFTDSFGRLTKIDETNSMYSDSFEDGNLNGWTNPYNNATLPSGQQFVHLIADSPDYQPGWAEISQGVAASTGVEGGGVTFSFQVANELDYVQIGLDHGAYPTSNYRLWGLEIHGGNLYLQEWIGNQETRKISLGTVAANTWYEVMLRYSETSDQYFSLVIWEQDKPSESAEVRIQQTGSEWLTGSWRFFARARDATLYFDDYQELDVYRTEYAYDTLDNLTSVADVYGNQTTISYDALGRKISMDDPDMGAWSYEYDPAGNLIEQTDANGNTLCFTYDKLSRILTKEVGSSPCPGSNILASYSYDNATNGVGQLSNVYWGPDFAQNYDSFSYDTLGRMYQQDRVINGRPYTMETLSYDDLNRPLQVQYPNGEIITMTYDHEGENTLTAGSDSLVSDVRYNARGQLTYVDRVHSWNMDTEFKYAGAANNFRLEKIINGTETTTSPNTGDNRPDFTYQYDNIGNILSIVTGTIDDGIDTQNFTYDNLNRLVTANATGDVADYSYNYIYNAIGNIIKREGTGGTLAYGYGYGSKPHAISLVNGAPQFYYDANGNMINRIEDDRGYIQIFDVENRLVQVTSGAAAVDSDFPTAYGAPNNEGSVVNNGLTSGFMDASRESNFTFTFDPNETITEFSLRMLDFGDYNPQLATSHAITLTAYRANGAASYTDSFSYTTLAETTPSSGTWISPNPGVPVGNLQEKGDAFLAPAQAPGNYTFTVGGANTNIARVELSFSNDVTGAKSSDPNIAFTDLCFTTQANGQICPDFSQVEPGHSIEGLGAVHPSLNISTGVGNGETTRFAYDASGQRILTIEPDGTEIYYPFPGYEEEVRPPISAGTVVAAPLGTGTTAFAGPVALAGPQTEQTQPAHTTANFLLYAVPLVLLAGLTVLCLAELSRWYWRSKGRNQALSRGTLVSLFLLLLLAGLAGWGQRVKALDDVVTDIAENPASEKQTGMLAPVAAPWDNGDIGSVGVAGSADETSGTFTIEGSGADIGGSVDAFHYVYQPLQGDGSIVAQVTSQTTPNYWSRAGLMMRESLAADSPHVTVAVMSQANRVHTYQRSSSGGTTATYTSPTTGSAPIWFKLERVGSTITSFRSDDGVNWTQLESLSTTMSGTIYVGMAVTSHVNSTLSTATFDNVSATGGTPPSCNYGSHDLSQNSRIEVEDFRCGGEGVAFQEDLAADTGPGSGDYRTDVSTEGPDLQTTTDVGGGYNLGWTRTGEWLEYEIIAPQAGDYDFTIRHAADTGRTPAVRLTVDQGGTPVSDSGVINLGDTSGVQNWANHVVTLSLGQGTNVLRLTIEDGHGNYNYIDAQPAATPTPTVTATATATATATPTTTPTATPTPAGDISGLVQYFGSELMPWPDVSVMLWDENTTTLLATTTADANGLYQFTDVAAGNYNVIACGYVESTEFAGTRVINSVPTTLGNVSAVPGTCPVAFTPTTPETITIYAAGTQGNDGTYPTMELRLNEEVVATFTNVQGDPTQRDFQAFTFSYYKPIDVTTVKVAFVNDDGPRNLHVDRIVVGGVIYESEAPTTYSTGTWTSGTGCDDDYKQSEVLGCNGYFQYSVRVQRTNYSLAGQAIGLRIVGSPDGDNGLYYMHTDHLGSTSTLSILKDDGTAPRVYDSRALYEPFGDYRVEPTGEYTDRGYTGHLGNNSGSNSGSNDLGLIYMNARYYVPGLARFASADTIVSDPVNPQSFNRYTYVLNSPLKLNDPSGHCAVDPYDDYADYDCWNEYNTLHERIGSYGYDPLEYLGTGEEWEYLGINLDEGFLLEAYENEAWHQQVPGGTYSDFVQGYIFYAIYQHNPELAFDHSAIPAVIDGISEPDSYTWANIYSTVIEESYFTPYGDQQYYNAIDEARANGNEDLAQRLSVIVTVGAPENNSGLPDIPIAPPGGAFSEFADAFRGWLDELLSGLVGE